MADYELKLLAPAWAELEAIADRHLNLVGPDSAQKITEKLLDSLENLKINPLLGIECTDKIIALDRYRKLISEIVSFKNYRKYSVNLLRSFYGKRKYINFFS